MVDMEVVVELRGLWAAAALWERTVDWAMVVAEVDDWEAFEAEPWDVLRRAGWQGDRDEWRRARLTTGGALYACLTTRIRPRCDAHRGRHPCCSSRALSPASTAAWRWWERASVRRTGVAWRATWALHSLRPGRSS